MFGQREKRTILDDKLDEMWENSLLIKLILGGIFAAILAIPIYDMAKDSIHLKSIKAHFSEHFMSICPTQPEMTIASCTQLEKQHEYICSNGAMGNGKVEEVEYYTTCLMQRQDPRWTYPESK